MVKSREIPRTATFAWYPGIGSPLIATGTRAGAVDADFSTNTQLELWDLVIDNPDQGHELQPAASVGAESRFYDIAWSKPNDATSKGLIAGALENGSLNLWNAEDLLNGGNSSEPVSRTSKHSGSIKALQFNPFRPDLLATAGAKGELYISDLNNVGDPYRMGSPNARVDDFDCLDWNKNVSHIMATGSTGGFVTIWDVKTRKESLTLNTLGRKAVSAVAWDPIKRTRLVTATPNDSEPFIQVWDLRNSNAPERTLRGHDGGILSLSWCAQDNDLLLSCGKDNRTICWNPQTGEQTGEFPVVTNWTFETRWNPQNPAFLATASFDGRIAVQTIQDTQSLTTSSQFNQAQSVDDEDFFNKAPSHSQGPVFSLNKPPKWLVRPCGASFGFGGKIVSFSPEKEKVSTVHISRFAVDAEVGQATEDFENALKEKSLDDFCKAKAAGASLDSDKMDWQLLEKLANKNAREDLVTYLGISTDQDTATDRLADPPTYDEDDNQTLSQPNGTTASRQNRLSSFFEGSADGDNFLLDLAATKGAMTNSPFQLYSDTESNSDREITQALLLGKFDRALDVCLRENRLTDAFMIAICGGEKCIEKAQKYYLSKKAEAPNYLRLLSSIVGRNFWDVVYNADLTSWKDIFASLCTYASAEEFPDLCEVLGERLEEQARNSGENKDIRKDALFCYLAGSKLERVVGIWLAELEENEASQSKSSSQDSSYSIHARSLGNFIEKVTIFRRVTLYKDNDRQVTTGWKLAGLYDKYMEYADLASAHGQLQIAEKYLDLLPEQYPAADVARQRVRSASQKPKAHATKQQPLDANRNLRSELPSRVHQNRQPPGASATAPSSAHAPSPAGQPQNPYAPTHNGPSSARGYHNPPTSQQTQGQFGTAPPFYNPASQDPHMGIRGGSPSTSLPVAPSKAQSMANWNDTPESFFKPPTSRRETPGISRPNSNVQYGYPGITGAQSVAGPSVGTTSRSTTPLPPPPKGTSQRTASPSVLAAPTQQQHERPPSGTTNAYAPQQLPSQPMQYQQQPGLPRGSSPYNAPPSAPPSNDRYAPNPTMHSTANPPSSTLSGGPTAVSPAPNPYTPRQAAGQQQRSKDSGNVIPTATPGSGAPPGSSGVPSGPPQPTLSASRPETTHSQAPNTSMSSPTRYPSGDRSHIPDGARPIYELLSTDMQRVKSQAPPDFQKQVRDTEKRLNILFDHLNNGDLLTADTIASMADLAQALQVRNYEHAQAVHLDLMTNKTDQCGQWMTENTPNVDAIKFFPNHPILPPDLSAPFIEYLSPRSTLAPPHPSPLAARLLSVDGVTAVFYGPEFITITKAADATWAHVKPEVFSLITEAVSSGEQLVNTTVAASQEGGSAQDDSSSDSLGYSEEDSEVVGMIKELLETRIRPAIQEDGGDIDFRGFENGQVLLKLRGACRTCDSSTVTLKNGIESMLMHYAS
ncbi:MAG: hypothetical protein LQ342_003228 [Letrouitia transgressa]|nr:MAG: hypothetical protein LQ342_003228 [Letrouitia transgressa]